jgi:hypothetical protein
MSVPVHLDELVPFAAPVNRSTLFPCREWGTAMSSDEYRRLSEACLIMARQPNVPDVQARWLVLAQTSSKLANDSCQKLLRQARGHYEWSRTRPTAER